MRLSEKFVIRLPLGLNLRAASGLAVLTHRFQCHIKVQQGMKCADARSILGLLTLNAQPESEIAVFFDGEDAEGASVAIREFFEEGPVRKDPPM